MPYAAMHFPTNAGSIFLTDDLTNDRYLVDTKATSVLFLVHQIAAHLEKMGYQSPLGALFPKLSSFRTNFSLPIFCKLPLQVPFWALIFEQVKNHYCSRDQPNPVCLCSGGPACRQTLLA
jgi:hypothetical protein